LSPKKIVVDTDIILEHLLYTRKGGTAGNASFFRKAMSSFLCYTTVFNAIEVFALCENEKEIQAVEDSLCALKILGLNGKSAKRVGLLVRRGRESKERSLDLLVAGLCVESKLPILTGRPSRYRMVKALEVLPARLLKSHHPTGGVISGTG
jgi:predicted nucleic acid-binding protein